MTIQRSPWRNPKRTTLSVIALTTLALLTLSACGGKASDSASKTADATNTTVALSEALPAGQWISNGGDFKDAANWDTAKTVSLDLGAGTITPSNVDLIAGSPYVIEITNSDSVEHGISAPDFLRSSAVRKAESPGGEIKVTLMKEIHVLPGKTMKLFIIPVMPGVTAMNGMTDGAVDAAITGTFSVTGSAPTTPAPAIEPIGTAGEIAIPANIDWNTATAVTVEMMDNGDAHFFKPKTLTLKVNEPVVLTFANKGTILHVNNAPDFLSTCALLKVVNAEGFVVAGKVRPADLEAGGEVHLYIVPTKTGTYKLGDEAPEMASMQATIVVK